MNYIRQSIININYKKSSLCNCENEIAFAFVGCVVPGETNNHDAVFSQAGNMCQLSLLLGLKHSGLPATAVLSMRPSQSFPRGRRLWFRKSWAILPEGIKVYYPGFLNIIPIKQISFGIATLWGLFKWGWRSRNIKHRIIYTYNISTPPGIFTLLGARLVRSKVVAMIYDINVPGETVPNSLLFKIDYWLHKKLLPRFDALVVISDSIIKDFAPKVPFVRVEGGLSCEYISLFKSKYKRKVTSNKFVIVIGGSLIESNGILILLEAFVSLKNDKYLLEITGRGPLENKIVEAAKKDSRITYHGYLTYEKVIDLYSMADVLINMKLSKTINTKYFFPSKMMEYLASGVPVISTCIKPLEEEYADFVFLLKDESPQSVVDMIQFAASMDPKNLREIGERAQHYMFSKKTWDAQGRRVAKFLFELLGLRQ